MRVLIACECSGVVRRALPGFPGYLITSDGRVLSEWARTRRTGTFVEMATSADRKGYAGLTLCTGAKQRRKVRVHRLVAEAFLPNPDQLPCVRHLDGNPSNNNVSNLAWGTYADNEADKVRHGTRIYAPRAKLTAEDRDRARTMKSAGSTNREIAAELKVSSPSISRLLSGKTWVAR